MYIKDIKEACRKILKGDRQALEQLGLENCKFPRPKPQNTATSALQLQYNCTLNSAVAARELNLSFLEKQCQLTLEYIEAIAQAKKVKLDHSTDGDVAELMLTLIDEEKKKYCKEGEEDMEEEGMEDEGETVEEGEEEQGVEDEDVEEEGMEDEGEVEVGVLPEDDKEETSSD